jgi:beta-glucosidase
MLKNNGLLPLKDITVSVFGRVQHDWFYVGYGSGGDVVAPYKISLMQGLEKNGKIKYNKELSAVYADWCKANRPDDKEWGKWPTHYDEMPITSQLVTRAKSQSDAAIVVIGRSAGEDRDSLLEEGSFYLTKTEENLLDTVAASFDKIVLLINSGNIIDFSWFGKYKDRISSLLYVWQGGMESGNAVCDILCGDESPSGKLTTSIAEKYEDYPSSNNFGGKDFNNYAEDIFVGYRYFETFAKDAVVFPFGYGLSYTNFEIEATCGSAVNGNVSVDVSVTNTGSFAGSEVVQVYYCAPQGVLGKPARQLAAFRKTGLLQPGSKESFNISFPLELMASYDDAGKTGNKSAYVLEAGSYSIYAGNSVRSAKNVGSITVDRLTVCSQLQETAAVDAGSKFKRIAAKENTDGSIAKIMEDVPVRSVSLKDRILANMPKEIQQTKDMGFKLPDVVAGKVSMEAFVAQLNIEELEALTRGDLIMNSPLGPLGNAGTFGGITPSLREKGIIPVTTTDGPSGIRLKQYCSLMPCGMALASTWNTRLLNDLATLHGKELSAKGSHVLLAPGMNILRNPLCGRNFEYFSEDPLLSGKMGAALVSGLQKNGKSSCPKHFACNNQEKYRNTNDSRLSERALREIYLKGFEICVKEAKPKNIMTSYNKINGVWGHYHYDLCTAMLRGEWGYEGNVITDWWMRPSQDPDFPALSNNAYRVRAQVDVLMPGEGPAKDDRSLLDSYGTENGITLAEIQRTAMNVLRFVVSVLK